MLQVGQTNHERRAIREEKQMARLTLVPILQAEEDRRCTSAHDRLAVSVCAFICSA